MRLGLIYAQSLHEPAVLLRSQGSGLAFLPWPLEAAGFQTLIEQDEAVVLPIQCLDPIPAPAAKQKEGVGIWIQIELLLDDGSKTIDAPAQVCVATGDYDASRTVEIL